MSPKNSVPSSLSDVRLPPYQIAHEELDELYTVFEVLRAELRKSPAGAALQAAVSRLESSILEIQYFSLHGLCEETEAMSHMAARKQSLELRFHLEAPVGLELPRNLQRALQSFLVHGVRNAIDHGMSGMSHGELRLRVNFKGGLLQVQLLDSGRGLDHQAILERAIQAGIVKSTPSVQEPRTAPGSDQSATSILDEAQIATLVFEPGISTQSEVTEWSGRGVGLAAVQEMVQSMGGSVQIRNPEKSEDALSGAVFEAMLPLTQFRARVTTLDARQMNGEADPGSARFLRLAGPNSESDTVFSTVFRKLDSSWKKAGPAWLKAEFESSTVLYAAVSDLASGDESERDADPSSEGLPGDLPFRVLKV